MHRDSDRLRVLTWHVHGNYLFYLAHAPHDFYVPFDDRRTARYGGRAGTLPWPANLHEVPAEEVRRLTFDAVLFQARENWTHDQYGILSERQRRLPRLYLEHDPPQEHPTNTRHPVDDPGVLLVHCTHFNELMWDSGRTPTRVIEHGVTVPEGCRYDGSLDRGVTVVNGLARRGRRLGADVFERVRADVPLDLAGMESEGLGGLGEVPWGGMASFLTRYRFFFNPIRFTSLGLAVLEAMMAGLPVVGLATTELAAVIERGRDGFVDTDVDSLVTAMRGLLADRGEAERLGGNARSKALERFGIERFARDWDEALREAAGRARVRTAARAPAAM